MWRHTCCSFISFPSTGSDVHRLTVAVRATCPQYTELVPDTAVKNNHDAVFLRDNTYLSIRACSFAYSFTLLFFAYSFLR